jgi:polysaccharide biosynthesis protein PslH
VTKPRVLLISPITPARSGNGLAMRQGVFHDSLSRVGDVDTLVLPVAGPAPDRDYPQRFGPVRTIPIAKRADTEFVLLSRVEDPYQRLRHFRRYGRSSRHAAISAPVLNEVREAVAKGRYELVHVGRLYLSEAAIAREGHQLWTLDLDEDDAQAWRLAATRQSPDEAAWSLAEAEAEDRLLGRVRERFARLFVAGGNDQETIYRRHPHLSSAIVENAISFPSAPEREDDGRTLLFVATLTYPPNREGLLWFAEEILPRLLITRPDLRLHVVGRYEAADLAGLADQKSITLLGPVQELDQAYAEASLAIAPLRSGGGTRLKLIEAAAHRVPIVATSVAAQGLDFARSHTMWLADTAEAFATAIMTALDSPTERRKRADDARALALPVHDRARVIDRLASTFADVLASRR